MERVNPKKMKFEWIRDICMVLHEDLEPLKKYDNFLKMKEESQIDSWKEIIKRLVQMGLVDKLLDCIFSYIDSFKQVNCVSAFSTKLRILRVKLRDILNYLDDFIGENNKEEKAEYLEKLDQKYKEYVQPMFQAYFEIIFREIFSSSGLIKWNILREESISKRTWKNAEEVGLVTTVSYIFFIGRDKPVEFSEIEEKWTNNLIRTYKEQFKDETILSNNFFDLWGKGQYPVNIKEYFSESVMKELCLQEPSFEKKLKIIQADIPHLSSELAKAKIEFKKGEKAHFTQITKKIVREYIWLLERFSMFGFQQFKLDIFTSNPQDKRSYDYLVQDYFKTILDYFTLFPEYLTQKVNSRFKTYPDEKFFSLFKLKGVPGRSLFHHILYHEKYNEYLKRLIASFHDSLSPGGGREIITESKSSDILFLLYQSIGHELREDANDFTEKRSIHGIKFYRETILKVMNSITEPNKDAFQDEKFITLSKAIQLFDLFNFAGNSEEVVKYAPNFILTQKKYIL